MLEVQTKAFMLDPAAKSAGWNHLPPPDYGIYYSGKELSMKRKRMERGRIRGEKAVIFWQSTLIWKCGTASDCKCKDMMTFKCVWEETKRGRRGWRKTKTTNANVEAKGKKGNAVHWWVELIQFEWSFFFHHASHSVSSFRSPNHFVLFFLSNAGPSFHFLLSFSAFYSTPTSSNPKTREHNPIPSYSRAYVLWKYCHILQPRRGL